jgi:uncharacterized protein YoxC
VQRGRRLQWPGIRPATGAKGVRCTLAPNSRCTQRWEIQIGIIALVLTELWNRIRTHPLQRKADHLDKRIDEALKNLGQGLKDLGQNLKELGQKDKNLKDLGQCLKEGGQGLKESGQKMESLAALIEQSTEVEKDDKADQPS